MARNLTVETINALESYNHDHNVAWNFGTSWTNVNTEFETFINKYLFPKINETVVIDKQLGNRFNWLAKEQDFVGQYSEEYVVMDSIPVAMNLSKSETLMLKRNYPHIASKLYGGGILKKQKFTLNNNDVRNNFLTLGDGVKYALAVYNKRISDINVQEEKEIKAMIIDYATHHTDNVRKATSLDDLSHKLYEGLLNIQNNSSKYNEVKEASGGTIGQYTTQTPLNKVAILTSDTVKAFLLDTKIANTFQIAGLDLSDRIISFDDLGGVYKLTEDVKIMSDETVKFFRAYGDYQMEKGDILPIDTILTFDVSKLEEFAGKTEEVKPKNPDLFAYVFDIDKLRYKRYSKNMIKQFYNGEFDEVTYWLHYYSTKSVSPFYNNILITE